ncbi:MAG: hypothetical protein MR598_03265 [Erysipelotrichaceae bacterium]|nr:hypothetical protein [Erysipelotrichaceae bacterium]
MYKQLKRQLDDKKIIERNIRELEDRIKSIIHRQLGLKGISYSDIKLEIVGTKDDKFSKTFAKVESLDKDLQSLIEEKNIIVDFIDDVYKSINNMNNVELNVFKCRYILGLSNRETAERLGYTIDRIKQINREISKKM